MGKYNVVITHKPNPKVLEKMQELFTVNVRTRQTPPEEWEAWLKQADGLYSLGKQKVDEEFLTKMPNLKVVSQVSMGYDNIDIQACTKKGVLVGNTPEVVTEATADIAFGLILCSARYLHKAWLNVKEGEWGNFKPFTTGVDLYNKTLGILGLGNVGAAAAKRAKASGMNIIYNNRKPSPFAEQLQARYVTFDELLKTADFILVTLPLSEQTRNMISREEFAKMKPTTRFINVGRGPIVDTQALYEALKEKRIAYAALDVVDPEPLPGDHPLLTLDNVVVFPHIGTNTIETRQAMGMLAFENLKAALLGEKMPACVNNELEK